jgi:hypothetical protein
VPIGVVLIGLLVGVMPVASDALPLGLPAAAHAATTAVNHEAVTHKAVTNNAVSITVAPTTLKPLQAGENLNVIVTIKNGTRDAIAPGTLDLYLAERALISRGALTNWLHPEKSSKTGDLLVSQAMQGSVQPDSTEILTLTVPADSVGLASGNAWGARGLAITLSTNGTVRAQGRGTFVWYSGEVVTPVNLSVIMPITAPEQSTGLIPSKSLESFTSPTGVLTRQLDGVLDRPVTIAIDPLIIVSIRILGNSAPPSATAWLNRLDQATNDIFPLSYADADLALQAQAGAPTLLTPTSFAQAIDPTLFTTPPTATPAPSTAAATDTPVPSTTPPSTPIVGTLPTSEQLLAWDYTATDIGWPAEGAVETSNLGVFAASGLNTTILAGANTTHAESDFTPSAPLALGTGLGLVADDPISSALRKAAMSTTDDAWREAMAEVSSQLAVVSAERPGTARTLLATFDRGWPPTAARLGETLDALRTLSWYAPATLEQLRTSTPATDVSFDSKTEPAERVALARRLLEREQQVGAFSSALADPVIVTGNHRLSLMALLANSWSAQPGGWADAVASSLASSEKFLGAITVSTKGPINVVGSRVDIPVTLDNALDQAVTVRVQVVPSNGRLLVGRDVEATIEAQSASTVKVPVTAAVGNGDVTLRVTLFTPAGTAIAEPSLIPINVRADWEGLGALIFAGAVVVFFGFGVWRNVLRRRREHSEPASSETGEIEAGTENGTENGTETEAEPSA